MGSAPCVATGAVIRNLVKTFEEGLERFVDRIFGNADHASPGLLANSLLLTVGLRAQAFVCQPVA